MLDYNQKIKMNEILVNLNNITDSFFNHGIYTDIDEHRKIRNIQGLFDKLAIFGASR